MSARRLLALLALVTLAPLLLLGAACDSSWQGAPVAEGSPRYTLALAGPAGPFRGPVTITATPDPPDGTLEVRFVIDGALADVDVTAPYTTTLDFTLQWGGPRRVTAVARRADGATAEAALDLTYDALAPFVTVVAPAAGAQVPLAATALDVSFVAGDVSGLASATVRVDDGEPLALSLPALALSVPLPAAPPVFPRQRTLGWSFTDQVGNQATGEVPFVQRHERFSTESLGGGAFTLPGGRVLLAGETLRMLEADGSVAWERDAADGPFDGTAAAADGGGVTMPWDAVASAFPRLERFRADGATAWRWPVEEGSILVTHVYVPDADVVFGVVFDAPSATNALYRVDAGGSAQLLADLGPSMPVGFLTTPPGEAQPGVLLYVGDGAGPTDVRMFDAGGALAWSGVTQHWPYQVLTRDAVLGSVASPGEQPVVGLLGPGGFLPLGFSPDATFKVAPNGDVLVQAGATLTRLRPDGATVWQAPVPVNMAWYPIGPDRVMVWESFAVHFLDATGAAVPWLKLAPEGGVPPPGDLVGTYVTPGALYLIETDAFATTRVHRVGADGVDRWTETFAGGFDPSALCVPGDDRVLVAIEGTVSDFHVLEP